MIGIARRLTNSLYLLGKAYFSSQSLFPNEPSAFTVPSHALPSASSFAISAPDGSVAVQPKQSKRKKADDLRPIKTLYTLETFQTPSPAWIYLTPWMINMRTGTDESGWRYNAWFRRKGWRSHAGPAGWAGWVRRREWVRLRCIRPKGTELAATGEREEEEVDPKSGLDEVMGSDEVEQNVGSVLKAMGRIPLDRNKIEMWSRWLDEGGSQSIGRLQRILDDEDAVSDTRHSGQLNEIRSTASPAHSRITLPSPP